MHAAHDAYRDAVNDCRLEYVLKKTDELPWYFTLLVGAVFSAFEGAITAGVRALKARGEAANAVAKATGSAVKSASELAGDELTKAVTLSSEVKLLSDKQVTAQIATSIKLIKDKGTAILSGVVSSDSRETQEKNAALAYIDYLRDTAGEVFQNLREKPPGTATDVELLGLWRSFDSDLHTTARYRTEVNEAIERYLASHVSKIGRTHEWEDDPRSTTGAQRQVERETRVAWVITRGAGKRLVYMDRAFDDWYLGRCDDVFFHVERSAAYDADENRLSLSQESTWRVDGKEQTHAEKPIRDDRRLSFVEQEFVELALEKQKRIWLDPPETFVEDWNHQIAVGVPRLVKVGT